jgi:hypothetical protein
VSYRRQFLEALRRQGDTEAEQVRREYHEAQACSDREDEETAAAMAAKKALTGEEEAELAALWKRLVKLYHPDRFANEPDKLGDLRQADRRDQSGQGQRRPRHAAANGQRSARVHFICHPERSRRTSNHFWE